MSSFTFFAWKPYKSRTNNLADLHQLQWAQK